MDRRPTFSSLIQWIGNRRVFSSILFTGIVIVLFLLTYNYYGEPYNAYHEPEAADLVPEGPYVPDPRAYEYFAAQHARESRTSAWEWKFERDRRQLTLNQTQCSSAFPSLYADIDRAVEHRDGRKITLQELDSIQAKNGFVRGMIYNQQVYVIERNGEIYSRGVAFLLALNRAVSTSPEPLPNIEFTVSMDDWLPPTPQWALARKANDHETWLMPDYGFWSWPETKVGSYGEVQDKAIEMEDSTSNPTGKVWSWENKVPKILWRGATMGMGLRKDLIKLAHGKSWADIKEINWHDKADTDANLKTMAEHCQYKFPINTAGNSYSGRLKYIQNCRSVIIMHKDDWITHHTHLMKKDGPEQNFVEVERDFSDLEGKVEALISNDAMAKTIADNNVKTFRERYLTPAAEVCYWRRLIRSWAAISFEPEFYKTDADGNKVWRGLPVESYVLERRMEWDPY